MDRDTYILLRGIAIIIVLLSLLGYLYTTQEGNSSQETKTIGIDELKEKAINLSYENLRRNTNKYKNEFVRFRGLVSQAGDSYALARVCKRCSTPAYSNYVYIEIYERDILAKNGKEVKRLIDGDKVVLWARVKGLKTYETVLGGSNTVPLLDLVYAKIL